MLDSIEALAQQGSILENFTGLQLLETHARKLYDLGETPTLCQRLACVDPSDSKIVISGTLAYLTDNFYIRPDHQNILQRNLSECSDRLTPQYLNALDQWLLRPCMQFGFSTLQEFYTNQENIYNMTGFDYLHILNIMSLAGKVAHFNANILPMRLNYLRFLEQQAQDGRFDTQDLQMRVLKTMVGYNGSRNGAIQIDYSCPETFKIMRGPHEFDSLSTTGKPLLPGPVALDTKIMTAMLGLNLKKEKLRELCSPYHKSSMWERLDTLQTTLPDMDYQDLFAECNDTPYKKGNFGS